MTDNQKVANEEIDLFKKKLMQDLQLHTLPENEQKEFEEKIEKLVNDRIMNLILIYLPPEKVEEFAKIIGKDDQQEILDYINKNIPDFGDKVVEEMVNIREDLITRVRKANADKK
jgi:hypothetical protein